jgi:hypothetical protein
LTADGLVVGVTAFQLAEGQSLNFAVPSLVIRKLLGEVGHVHSLLGSDKGEPDQDSDPELREAQTAIERRDWATAARVLSRLREASPSNPLVWLMTGRLQEELGNEPGAIEAYRRGVLVGKESPVTHLCIAELLHEILSNLVYGPLVRRRVA